MIVGAARGVGIPPKSISSRMSATPTTPLTLPTPPTLILATGNPHKVDELRAIFAAIAGAGGAPTINVLGLADLPFHAELCEPEEHGTTFEENARVKALSYATQIAAAITASRPDASMPHASMPHASMPSSLLTHTSFLCLADDSGLEIDALHGRPGVISSHYSTDGRETGMTRPERDSANNARVLRELESVPMEQRTARFVCCMCLARPERPGESFAKAILHETRGTFEGRIGHPHIPPRIPAGTSGFGYDPLFLVAPEYTHTGAELSSATKNALSHRGAAAREMAQWIAAARW